MVLFSVGEFPNLRPKVYLHPFYLARPHFEFILTGQVNVMVTVVATIQSLTTGNRLHTL